jgi:hypothetical protein
MGKAVYRTSASGLRGVETLRVECWCRCTLVDLPSGEVRAGRTFSGGRRLCDAMGFAAALRDGEPCDCEARAQPG